MDGTVAFVRLYASLAVTDLPGLAKFLLLQSGVTEANWSGPLMKPNLGDN